ncbi:hypothetical protein Ga0123462_1969 [Mariprofundus ferrinatatus]|uniref:Uncharacterized protein n=1 Tax=Mariprofundus ferrinatatus TaxID=1921087 RepID=A0A2K8LEW0_9PROT|nr:hypothetical protein Ga0123462_1969 [Mariprofundus ferrinatatus]
MSYKKIVRNENIACTRITRRGTNVNEQYLIDSKEEEKRREAWEQSLNKNNLETYTRPDFLSIGLMLALIVVFGIVAVAA